MDGFVPVHVCVCLCESVREKERDRRGVSVCGPLLPPVAERKKMMSVCCTANPPV